MSDAVQEMLDGLHAQIQTLKAKENQRNLLVTCLKVWIGHIDQGLGSVNARTAMVDALGQVDEEATASVGEPRKALGECDVSGCGDPEWRIGAGKCALHGALSGAGAGAGDNRSSDALLPLDDPRRKDTCANCGHQRRNHEDGATVGPCLYGTASFPGDQCSCAAFSDPPPNDAPPPRRPIGIPQHARRVRIKVTRHNALPLASDRGWYIKLADTGVWDESPQGPLWVDGEDGVAATRQCREVDVEFLDAPRTNKAEPDLSEAYEYACAHQAESNLARAYVAIARTTGHVWRDGKLIDYIAPRCRVDEATREAVVWPDDASPFTGA